ncbi:MAG: hypothetical protein ACE5OP_04070 [Candidatus Glassbacteria bacterium]
MESQQLAFDNGPLEKVKGRLHQFGEGFIQLRKEINAGFGDVSYDYPVVRTSEILKVSKGFFKSIRLFRSDIPVHEHYFPKRMPAGSFAFALDLLFT